MRKATLVSTFLALLCAGPYAVTGAPSRTASVSTGHALRIAHQDFAGMSAPVPEPPTVFPRDGRNSIPTIFTKLMG
jgi:hypothetical protein